MDSLAWGSTGMEQPVTVPVGVMGQVPSTARGWANPELQTVPFPEVSLLWYQKG